MVQLSRPVRIKKTPFRSRQSMRSAVINKSALTNQSPDTTSEEPSTETTDVTHDNTDEQQSSPVNGSMSESEEDKGKQRAKHVYLRFVNTQTPDFIFVLNSLNRLRIPLNRQMQGFIQLHVRKRG